MYLHPSQARAVFHTALRERFALLAVNADSPAAVRDCLEAARECSAPIIIETSLWQLQGRSFGMGDPVLGLALYAARVSVLADSQRYREVPVILHTDHIKGPQTMEILGAGIRGIPVHVGQTEVLLHPSTISLDSSELSEEENIRTMNALCAIAAEHECDVTLEMEAGVDDGITSPEDARRLLGAVENEHPGRLALWAPGVGTRHGLSAEGYPAFSADAVQLHAELASELCGRPIGIALHGSSGLPSESLQAAVAAGVAKVNWSSESLLVRSTAAGRYFAENHARLQPAHKEFKAHAMDNGLQKFVAQDYIPKVIDRIRTLGGSGRASACMEAARKP